MIVLWGIADEPPMAAVRAALARANADVFMIDQRAAPELSIELAIASQVTGRVIAPDRAIKISEVKAIYLRPYAPTAVPAVRASEVGSRVYNHAVALHEAMRAWTDASDALVVTRTDAASSNSSKPYQAALAAAVGFAIPDTLLTTDPKLARTYLTQQHDNVIYKSMSDVRSVVSRFGAVQRAHLDDIRGCPLQLQEQLDGFDVRVHVVGNAVFACEIVTKAVDYRYPGNESVRFKATSLPAEIAELCVTCAQQLQLPVAGIDLRHTRHDEWMCFEINPSPAFTSFDLDGGIAQAIAELLIGGTP